MRWPKPPCTEVRKMPGTPPTGAAKAESEGARSNDQFNTEIQIRRTKPANLKRQTEVARARSEHGGRSGKKARGQVPRIDRMLSVIYSNERSDRIMGRWDRATRGRMKAGSSKAKGPGCF